MAILRHHRRKRRALPLTAALCLLLGGCTSDSSSETTSSDVPTTAEIVTTSSSDPDPTTSTTANAPARLEVALVFKYHQPYLPPINGAVELPWARLEASHGYMDIARFLGEFDTANASLAMSGPLIQQLQSLTNARGDQRTVDRHYLMTSTPIDQLTPDDKQFILNNFFDGPGNTFEMLERWDQLRELRDAGSTLTDADLRDITVLFHLAQLEQSLIEGDPTLASLLEKGSSYSDADARTVLQAIDNQVDQIGRAYGQLIASDRLEVITSTGVLAVDEPLRIKANTSHTLGVAADYFGEAPRGLTLAGDVAGDSGLSAMAAGGAQWVLVTDPSTPADETAPTRLSLAGGPIVLISAQTELADQIQTQYFELSAAEAVEDFVSRLGTIADSQPLGEPGLVTVVIEGTDVWSQYENNGSTFLRTLLNALTTSEDFRLTTPSKYLRDHPDQVGSATSASAIVKRDTASWAGEPEEDMASDMLADSYLALDQAETDGIDPQILTRADNLVMNAEAADFRFYFGQDHDSVDDGVYDRGFRQWLSLAYEAIEVAPPANLASPIVAAPQILPVSIAAGEVAINIDGNPSDWSKATLFDFADSNDVITDIGVALDGDDLALRFDGGIESEVQIYIGIPGAKVGRSTSISGDSLGFGATHLIVWTDTEGACISDSLPPDSQIGTLPAGCIQLESALSEAGVELKISTEMLGVLRAGDLIALRIKSGSSLGPILGPVLAEIPPSSP